ncbi:alpha/beta hydrolase [Paenibacillus agaridevorans]|uniref:Alpha/beta hydrolase n=1 Tax=Paenibacillus agaridevorans TaxID=171404 RepID=A0A2R5EPC9_9BACL|nr:alpha/beta hydrolase [Paenibacillus agaridevorans]GBG05623.1 alpha/beta hydrolase [Paenibacillus agaridevorans]
MVVEIWQGGAPYAQGDQTEDCPRLIPYLLKGKEPVGALIICPGGGYESRADYEGGPIAEWLNSIGIAAFVLHYRVSPYRYPVPLLDAQRAIRLVRHRASEWGVDPARVGILGFSAGGHLASTAGTHYDNGDKQSSDPIERMSCRPDLMVLCYPVITFGEFANRGSRANLLGSNDTPEWRDYLSNEKHIDTKTPPAFLWHTADDKVVRVENVLLFAMALSRHNVPYDLHIYESGRHGLGLALHEQETRTWTGLCEKWLRKRGF